MTTLDDNPDDNTGWHPPDDNHPDDNRHLRWQPPDDNPLMTTQKTTQLTTPDDNSHLRWQHQMTTTNDNTKWQQLPATHLTNDNGDNDRDDNLDDNTQMTT
jgi:hypothetical protein